MNIIDLKISPLTATADAEACARIMSLSEPWVTLRRGEAASLRLFRDETRERYVAHRDGRLAGFLILNLNGPLAGYLQTIGIAPECRGQGIGTGLVRFAEERIFREHPNVFLCVSSFNVRARALYERLGYRRIGEIEDYVVAGHAEILLRKTRGPLTAS